MVQRENSLPTIYYFSLRSGFKNGLELNSSPRPPAQPSGFGGFFVRERGGAPRPKRAARALRAGATSRGRRAAGARGAPSAADFPRADCAGRSRPGRRLGSGEREGAKLRGNERRAEAGRARGKRAPSACCRGAAGAPRRGGLLTHLDSADLEVGPARRAQRLGQAGQVLTFTTDFDPSSETPPPPTTPAPQRCQPLQVGARSWRGLFPCLYRAQQVTGAGQGSSGFPEAPAVLGKRLVLAG